MFVEVCLNWRQKCQQLHDAFIVTTFERSLVFPVEMNSTLSTILFGSIRVRTSSGDINASFLVDIQANGKFTEEVEEESSGERPFNVSDRANKQRRRSRKSFGKLTRHMTVKNRQQAKFDELT